jgi:hypothetical protein
MTRSHKWNAQRVGEKVKPGVAVCRTCRAILDREKAKKFGFVGEEATITAEMFKGAEKSRKG